MFPSNDKIPTSGMADDTTSDNWEIPGPNMTTIQNDTSYSVSCNYDYIPTISETSEALGDFGVAMLTTGVILTLALYGLFAEQVYYTYTTCHKVFRRHIIWITSVYPFMTMMSVIATAIPRADSLCTAVKVTYMSIGISHFTDLTTSMFGSEKAMLAYLEGRSLNLQVGPCCCCLRCLPSPPVNKIRIRIVRWLLWQMPYTQAIYFILTLLWSVAESESDGTVDPNENYLWLNTLNFTSFISGVYALQIMAAAGTVPLEDYNYNRKAFSVKTLVLVTKMQSFIFDIMATYNAFPCIGPYISPRVYKQTVENCIYLVEMLILGPYTYWQYHNEAFMTANPKEPRQFCARDSPKEVAVSTISKSFQAEGPAVGGGPLRDLQEPHKDHSAYVDLSAIVLPQTQSRSSTCVTEQPRTTDGYSHRIRENLV
ncbi:organic solute transporter subunit alpha-like isoform X1 [Penaeus indicus]|uniref:organic solute transporter subunit alpha-like isoform X1 n=2 Tax=Penaeus indicus TaxID=29960 RepID=UPI00300D18C6